MRHQFLLISVHIYIKNKICELSLRLAIALIYLIVYTGFSDCSYYIHYAYSYLYYTSTTYNIDNYKHNVYNKSNR